MVCGHRSQYEPLTIISPRAILLSIGLMLRAITKTLCDNLYSTTSWLHGVVFTNDRCSLLYIRLKCLFTIDILKNNAMQYDVFYKSCNDELSTLLFYLYFSTVANCESGKSLYLYWQR